METDTRVQAIMNLYNQQKSIRAVNDKKRWLAMAYADHRTDSLNSPIPEVHLYDSAGKIAIRTLVEGLIDSIMSPQQNWFSLRIVSGDFHKILPPSYGVEYTTYAKRAMKNEFDHSNFYEEQNIASYDAITCGYSCTLFQNDEKTKRIYLQTFEPWNCWFDTDTKGNYNIFLHRYYLDGLELLERFGENLTPEKRDEAKRTGKDGRYEMLMVIMQRPYFRDSYGKIIQFSHRIAKRMKYACVHILLDTNQIVSETGYRDFPVIIHVWEKDGISQYGVGLVMKHIEEFGKLNRLAFEYGTAIAKINHVPWLVPDTMLNSFSDDPESIIPYQSSDLIPRPLQEPIDINAAGEQLTLQQNYIAKIFYNEIFSYLLNQDKVYTATQINAVKSEGLSKISPIYSRIQSQKIDPSLKLVFKIMLDNGRVDLPEDTELFGTGNKFEFILDSSMSQMIQRYQMQTSNAVLMDLIAQLTQLGYASQVRKYINVGNLILSHMEQTGADSPLYVTAEERKRIEEEERELMRMQLEQQAGLAQSEINRNNAGAANLNNAAGANGGFQ